jgi:MOSC domain-containing protein YiiM
VGEVLRLFVAVVHRHPMREVEEILAVRDQGLAGCVHGRPGSRRQVLLMDVETLDECGLPPGVAKENITTRGLDLRRLRTGQRLRVGEALFEVCRPCEPCRRMDEIRDGLQEELRGRRGILCRVVKAGRIRRGEGIELLSGPSAES